VIERADPRAQVLLGELAPRGHRAISTRSPVSPLPFLRELACVDRRYKRMRRGPCRGFLPARADAFGYHPHGVEFGPEDPNPDRDQAQIGDIPRLFAVLDRLRRGKRLRVGPGLHLTEFGYQTSPPDHAIGVTLAQQTRYLQQAAYIAWSAGRVRSLAFYQWDDEPVIYRGRGTRAYSGWQSGLRFVTGRPKPALSTFDAPVVYDRRRKRLWGQVRPDAEPVVTLMVRPRGASSFTDFGQATLASDGSFTHRTFRAGAAYRYRWTPKPSFSNPLPAPRLSGIVDLARKDRSDLRPGSSL
jgi:hypothetical protein